jgi:hypothetical protein
VDFIISLFLVTVNLSFGKKKTYDVGKAQKRMKRIIKGVQLGILRNFVSIMKLDDNGNSM